MVEQSSGFVLKKEQRVPSLNITAQLFEHARTGALHLHLESAEKENVFLVALRTIPQDSTGVAHILEHTALCGSEKYPVRDPFFMMIRRSVNTFMNAFTSSDWTAYPFASVNRTDFDNLLEVYLDAVFFSRIDELDFRQEGHRLDLVTPEDVAGSELCFKGVVYNEMKGAMSAPSSRAWHTLCENLFPSSTYHFNSGGDPEVIPDLEYEALKAFYAKHYHPSNALFVTFGDIPAHSHQHRFETLALNRFERLDETIEVSLEAPFEVPRIALGRYPVTVKENEAKAYQLMAWLLDESTDIETALEAELLNGLLLANSSAPLQNFLETTPLGTHPSSLCGLETSMRQMVFVCGLEGAKTEVASEFENEVLALLRSVAEEGVPQEQIDAMIHQMELQHREISGGSYPYGLHIILRVLPALIHRGDPFKLLDMDAALETLREKAAQPDFVKTLIHRFLLDNPHRLLMTMKPDPLLAQEEAQREKERLELMAQNLDEAARQRILELNSVLAERQQRQDDDSILPKIRVSEISHEMKFPEYRNIKLADYSCTLFDAPTQGLVYQRMVVDLPDLDASEMRWLGFFSSCLSELGVASLDYRQRQARQTLWTGGVGASSLAFSDLNDEQKVTGFFVFSGKALSRNQAHLCDLMDDVLKRARFDEVEHMKDILKRSASHAEQSIVPNGHAYAMMAASSGMSPLAARAHHSTGLLGIQALKRLTASLDDAGVEAIAETCVSLYKKIGSAPRQFLLIGEAERMDGYVTTLRQQWAVLPNPMSIKPYTLPACRQQVRQVWSVDTQVNYCAKAFPTVPAGHPDYAALRVLALALKNGYLHRAIREQGGAYGGGATVDGSMAAFRFFSYRDPRLLDTLDDFDRSVKWLRENGVTDQALEEAILGVISAIDKPSTPAGEAGERFMDLLAGVSIEQRRKQREDVLKVTQEDLVRVAETYLSDPSKASVAVITNKDGTRLFDAVEFEHYSMDE